MNSQFYLLMIIMLQSTVLFSQQIELSHTINNLTISEDGRYALAEGALDFTVTDLQTRKTILESELSIPIVDGILSLGKSGGAGVMLFGEQDRVISIEYSSDTTILKGYDLQTGKQIYQLDTVLLGISKAEEFIKAVEVMSTAKKDRRRTFDNLDDGNRLQLKRFSGVYLKNEALKSCVHVMPALDAMLIVTREGVLLFDVITGIVRWNQMEFPSGVAEAIYIPEQNSIVMMNAYENDINRALAQKVIFNVDAASGELIWESEYTANYFPESSYVVGDRLLLDYYGLEIFNLKTGENLGINFDKARIEKFMLMGLGLNPENPAASLKNLPPRNFRPFCLLSGRNGSGFAMGLWQ